MPRIKANPSRRRTSSRWMESDAANESVLDDEEIQQLEQELDSLRREKAKQIRKMRYKREERRHIHPGISESSSESDVIDYSDGEEEENQATMKARQSTRELANGFEKVQQRFMFNVRHIEDKYSERERRGLPESQIEIDYYGNFYFPESMASCHQQAFVNRMYQNDKLLGKGSVSAPRNSLQSFDGDHRALKKSLQLDEIFGRKFRKSEVLAHRKEDGRDHLPARERIISSAFVSGIPKKVLYSSTASSSRLNSRFSEDLDDSVFDTLPEKSQSYPREQNNHNRHPTTSTMVSLFNDEASEEDEEFADDEENSEEDSSDEEISDEEEWEDEKENTPVARNFKKERECVEGFQKTASASRRTHDEERCSKAIGADISSCKRSSGEVKTSFGTPAIISVKTEPSRHLEDLKTVHISRSSPSKHNYKPSTPKLIIKKEVENETIKMLDAPIMTVEKKTAIRLTTTHTIDNLNPTTVLESVSKRRNEIGTPSNDNVKNKASVNLIKKEGAEEISIIAFKPSTPKVKDSAITTRRAISDYFPPTSSKRSENNGKLTSTDYYQNNSKPPMALSERPKRVIKPTDKALAAKMDNHIHCDDHDHFSDRKELENQKSKTKVKTENRKKAPYCKHCEFVKEEKKKAKIAKNQLNKATDEMVITSVIAADSSDTCQKSAQNQSNSMKDEISKNKKVNFAKKAEKTSPRDRKEGQLSHSKRRSGTVGSEEPEKKKQKLVDSDLLSIPSSMAVVVDTELINAENASLSSENIPKFSENSPETSVWSSTVDVQWIKDVKQARGKTKDIRFFGVQLTEYPKDIPVINFWVDNLCDELTRDQFDTDYRRSWAQDKKARNDMKAGYDVRF